MSVLASYASGGNACVRVQTGEKDRIFLVALTAALAGATGLTILLSIRRQSDSFYWSGTGFTSTYATLTMTETDSVNLPGTYHYDFTHNGIAANYLLTGTTASATPTNKPWVGELKGGNWVDNLDTTVSSRGSSVDLKTVLARIGGSIVDLDLKRVTGLVTQVLQKVGSLSLQ